MNSDFLPGWTYRLLYFLLAIVYIIGLFVPLMDTDAAHHADIALRMHLSGDYVNLIGHRGDYLDKPHLHFWLSAFSYAAFGVNSFAYKLPSLLFAILGIFSAYRLGKKLYGVETGKLAALIIATSFAYMLACNDVRMDAILTASIAFASWQLVEFLHDKKIINIAGSALGLALGFSTKGQIGVFVPLLAALLYILYRKDWKLVVNWKWLLLLLFFAILIFPVLYCYYEQYNLHPEKMARGKTNINGIKFILLDQGLERFSGNIETPTKNDPLFFIHSFLWAFAPWSLLAVAAVVAAIKPMIKRKKEWLTIGLFICILIVVSLSSFKLPHYLNILFPVASVFTAEFILSKKNSSKWIKGMLIIQAFTITILLLFSAVLNSWFFPIKSFWLIPVVILLLALVFYFIKSSNYSSIQKTVLVPAATMIVVFFLLNSNFYPQLLKYQGGNELAFQTRDSINPKNVYYWKDYFNSSYIFYTATLLEPLDTVTLDKKEPTWILADIKLLDEIKAAGYELGKRYAVPDYEITRLDLKFLNPKTRETVCTRLVLAEVLSYHNNSKIY